MKKDLHRDYSALCNNTTVHPTLEYLFGHLSKLTKDISDANKLARKVRPQHVRGPNRKFRALKEIVVSSHTSGREMIFYPKAVLHDQSTKRRGNRNKLDHNNEGMCKTNTCG